MTIQTSHTVVVTIEDGDTESSPPNFKIPETYAASIEIGEYSGAGTPVVSLQQRRLDPDQGASDNWIDCNTGKDSSATLGASAQLLEPQVLGHPDLQYRFLADAALSGDNVQILIYHRKG